MELINPAHRLIVAADFKPDGSGRLGVKGSVLALANRLAPTGVCIKVNSALLANGYDLIDMIHQVGLPVFADLKLNDIGNTLEYHAAFLHESPPDCLTVMSNARRKNLEKLKAALPESTELWGVGVLSDFDDEDARDVYGTPTIEEATYRLAKLAVDAQLNGVVGAPAEIGLLRACLPPARGMSINTPNVRFADAEVSGDDQNRNRSMTPFEAISAGATRIIVGRPITQADDQYTATMRFIEEIDKAMGYAVP